MDDALGACNSLLKLSFGCLLRSGWKLPDRVYAAIDFNNVETWGVKDVYMHKRLYGAHGQFYRMWAWGASLNDILNETEINSSAIMVTFYGSDGHYGTVIYPYNILPDKESMIAYHWWNNDDTGLGGNNQTMRNIEPHDTYAQFWTFDLVEIKVQ